MKAVQKLLVVTSLLSFTGHAYASPPFIADDASPEDYKHAEIYLFTSTVRNDAGTNLSLPAVEVDYGLIPNVEFNVVAAYTSNSPKNHQQASTSGIGDTRFGLKYLFLKETNYFPQMVFEPYYYAPFGNASRGLGNGRGWEQFPIWLQKSWGTWTTFGGGGYSVNGEPDTHNFFFGGWVLQKNITEKLRLGTELYIQGASSTTSTAYKLINLGGEYRLTDKLGVVFGIGHTFVGEETTVSYLAVHLST